MITAEYAENLPEKLSYFHTMFLGSPKGQIPFSTPKKRMIYLDSTI
jgi:hypothetical protein